ncbi:MAG TPA: RluA family pseudouridine synthase [Thermoleophilaceae bacterium]|nr:RluA family pseudouridine synthase [Thermoleophilaceae bacterium]
MAAEDAGLRLDAFLAVRGAFPSRAAAQRAIERGEVTVDGGTRPKNHRVEEGEGVSINERERAPERAATTRGIEVVHEDKHLIVVDKPAGLVTHPAPGHHRATLAELLPEGTRVVHRLDKDTSGLLLLARSDEAQAALQRMMKAREVTREYVALVEGHPDAESGTIDAPIGRDRGNRTVMSTRTDRARDAVTHFEVVERLPRTALLRVRLETGRTHQIRAHLAAIGHPVAGDPQYGGRESGGRLGLQRQFLHASSLMFRHPFTREWVRCESKPPVELSHALDTARREPVSGGPDGG